MEMLQDILQQILDVFQSFPPLVQIGLVVGAIGLIIGLGRFAFHIIWPILAIGCAIVVAFGIIWALFHYLF